MGPENRPDRAVVFSIESTKPHIAMVLEPYVPTEERAPTGNFAEAERAADAQSVCEVELVIVRGMLPNRGWDSCCQCGVDA